jgi:sigma-B regulation protein RsbU (phosphoserine phosphatase)
MSIRAQITRLVLSTALLATAILTGLGYFSARRQYLAGIDRQLTAAVEALPKVIGNEYITRALSGDVPDERYTALVETLSDLAGRSNVYYLYAFEQTGDGIVHLATSASAAERAAGDWSAFRDPYEEPPPELLATFADGVTRFSEYTDEFGSFRSIFVRRASPNGGAYVTGADVTLSQIHADLAAMVAKYLAAGGAVAVLAGILGSILAARIARPLQTLAHEVQSWSARDFERDDTVKVQIDRLARSNRNEIGELARRFVDVQDRLQTYLRELTEATTARQKIENQIEIAKSIQEGLLPQKPPEIEHFQILGWSQPADQTGGDYFDWLELPDGRMLLTIGDVTGHGIGPALVTAASRAYARATASADFSLNHTVARLNDLLHGDLRGERFVTLVACLLDSKSRHMKLLAAGHGPIIYYSRTRDEVSVTVDSHGLPLGVMDGMPYDDATDITFERGDALVLVSDGFFEWLNGSGESFGTQRLGASILASCREAPEEIVERLRCDVARFHGGTIQADDTTALIIRCVS